MVKDVTYPLVSIVVVTYNSSKYVIETLQSIRDQTYAHLELIVSDDCSTDDTVSVCKEWLEKYNSRFTEARVVTTTKNSGIAPNCNVGLGACKGEWVKFIAGDDALEPSLVEEYIRFASQRNDVDVICSNVRRYQDSFDSENACPLTNSAAFRFNQPGITAAEQFQILLRCNPVWAPTVMLKKALIDKMGGFSEQYAFYEDRPMWLELTRAGHRFHYIDMVSIKYRLHQQSVQLRKNKEEYIPKFEVMRDKILLDDYGSFMTPLERLSFRMITFRHHLILHTFGNRRNLLTKGITFFMYYLPNKTLRKFQDKYNS